MICEVAGSWTIRDTRPGEDDPGAPLILNDDGTGEYANEYPVTHSINDSEVRIDITFPESTANLIGEINADCNQASGTWDNPVTGFMATWEMQRDDVASISRASTSQSASSEPFQPFR